MRNTWLLLAGALLAAGCSGSTSSGPIGPPPPSAPPGASDAGTVALPGAPIGVTATAGVFQALLQWSPPDAGGGAISEYVIRSLADGGITRVDGATTTATVLGLQAGAHDQFSVAARNAAGLGPAALSNEIVEPDVPAAPAWVDAEPGDGAVLLSWSPADDRGSALTDYTIAWYQNGMLVGTTAVSGSSTSTTIAGLINGTTYDTFTVQAANAVGEGAPTLSNYVVVGTPEAPTGFTAVAGVRSADLQWTPAPDDGGLQGYWVNGNGTFLASAPPSATSLHLRMLTAGQHYQFTLTPYNAVGPGRSVTSNGIDIPGPLAPTGVTVTPGDGGLEVSWVDPPTDGGFTLTGFTVSLADQTHPIGVGPSATSAWIPGLINGDPYSVTVVAHSDVGNSTASAPTAPIAPVGPPTVMLSPQSLYLVGGGSAPFFVRGTDADAGWAWSVLEPDGGTVSDGLYTAPATDAGIFHLEVASVAHPGATAQAQITVVPPPVPAPFPDQYSYVASTPTTHTGFFFQQAIFDLGHDQVPDVIVAYGNDQPNAGFLEAVQYDAGALVDVSGIYFAADGGTPLTHPRELVVADFTGDGLPDLFIADHGTDRPPFPGGQSKLLVQHADGTLVDETATRLSPYPRPAFTHNACAADVNGDGAIDLLEVNLDSNGPELYLNDGAGHLVRDELGHLPDGIGPNGPGYTACLFVDVDLDGDLDLVLGLAQGQSFATDTVLLNDGRGYFSVAPANTLPPKWNAAADTIGIHTADFNRDGWPDLVLATNTCCTSPNVPALQLFLNNGDGTFRDATAGIPGTPWTGGPPNDGEFGWARPADFDGYGWPGFVTTRVDGDINPRFFDALGNGSFADRATNVPFGSVDLLPFDIDGDGDVDILVNSGGGSFVVMKNGRIP